MTVTYSELPTIVLYLTGIDPLDSTFTHSSNTIHQQENVLGLLIIPVEATIDLISQNTEVKTDIMLCRSLPLDIIIATLITHIAVWKVVTTV